MVALPMTSHDPRNVQLVTPIRLERNISKTAADAIILATIADY